MHAPQARRNQSRSRPKCRGTKGEAAAMMRHGQACARPHPITSSDKSAPERDVGIDISHGKRRGAGAIIAQFACRVIVNARPRGAGDQTRWLREPPSRRRTFHVPVFGVASPATCLYANTVQSRTATLVQPITRNRASISSIPSSLITSPTQIRNRCI